MSDQFILSSTLIGLLFAFIWGKFRYDALTIGALLANYIWELFHPQMHLLGFHIQLLLTVALVLDYKSGLKKFWIDRFVGKIIGTRKVYRTSIFNFFIL